ncbi:MAG: hypothetical protein QOH96_2765 [Blastocatellia bacterium]|jgi:hypothetical protein|nr:hypothetical protein [Blastocatellia bacterium]
MITFYHVQVGAMVTQIRTQPARLARLFLRHDQRINASNVLRRSAAGWDCCCAEGGKAALVLF